jgi:hypothetical protein
MEAEMGQEEATVEMEEMVVCLLHLLLHLLPHQFKATT